MTCSDGVASHIFEQGDLVSQRIFVNSSPERTEVMVVADAFELTGHAVELEAIFRCITDGTDSKAVLHFVNHLLPFVYTRTRDI